MGSAAQSAMFLPSILHDRTFLFNLFPLHVAHRSVVTTRCRALFLSLYSFESFFRKSFSNRGMMPMYCIVLPHSLAGCLGLCSSECNNSSHSWSEKSFSF